MIGPGIVADAKDRVAVIEVLQGHGSLADANRLRQTDAGRLVAHIRAIGKVVGAVFPRKQLIEKSRLIGGPAGGVKLRHIGVRQLAERGTDFRQRLVPRNRQVSISSPVVGHRMRQTPLILQVEVRPIPELADGTRGEKFRGCAFGCRLPGDSLDAVLAELERRGMFRIGPGAAGAIQPVRLADSEETASLPYDGPLTANGIGHGFQRAPPRCSSGVLTYPRNFVFAHCAPHVAEMLTEIGRFHHRWSVLFGSEAFLKQNILFPRLCRTCEHSHTTVSISIKLSFRELNSSLARAIGIYGCWLDLNAKNINSARYCHLRRFIPVRSVRHSWVWRRR